MAPNSRDNLVRSISTSSFYTMPPKRQSIVRKKLNGGNSASLGYLNELGDNGEKRYLYNGYATPSRKRSYNSTPRYSNKYDCYSSPNTSNYNHSGNRFKLYNNNHDYNSNYKRYSPYDRSPIKKNNNDFNRHTIKKRKLFTNEKTVSPSNGMHKYLIKRIDVNKVSMKKKSISDDDRPRFISVPDEEKNNIRNETVLNNNENIDCENIGNLFIDPKYKHQIKKPVTLEEVRKSEDKENEIKNSSKLELNINKENELNNQQEFFQQDNIITSNETKIVNQEPVTDKNKYKNDILFPVSLRNLGNTCYMNSVVQVLFNLPFLMCELRDSVERIISKSPNLKFDMTNSVLSLFDEYKKMRKNQCSNDDELEKRLCSFKYNVCQHSSEFKSSGQHDAVEFLDFVINGIKEEFDNLKNLPKEQNPVNRVFHVELGEASQCENCKTKFSLFNTISHCLILSLPEEKLMLNHNWTLQHILNNYFKPEKRESKCSKCGCLERYRHLSVTKLPRILILQLGRYSATGEKRHEPIKVPLEIGLPNTINSQMNKKSPNKLSTNDALKQKNNLKKQDNLFKLSGVICHHGNCPAGGHYISYVQDLVNDEWFNCDDDSISRTTFERVQEGSKSSGYCFFYLNKKYI